MTASASPSADALSRSGSFVTPTGLQAPEDVAEVIWTAITDGTARLRYVAGAGAESLLAQRYSVEQDEGFVPGLRAQSGL